MLALLIPRTSAHIMTTVGDNRCVLVRVCEGMRWVYASESLPSGRLTETGKFIAIRVAGVWFASGMGKAVWYS